MQYGLVDNRYIIRVARGELVSKTLTIFCQDQKIHNALFTSLSHSSPSVSSGMNVAL